MWSAIHSILLYLIWADYISVRYIIYLTASISCQIIQHTIFFRLQLLVQIQACADIQHALTCKQLNEQSLWSSVTDLMSKNIWLLLCCSGTVRAARWVLWLRHLSPKPAPCRDRGERDGSETASASDSTPNTGLEPISQSMVISLVEPHWEQTRESMQCERWVTHGNVLKSWILRC